MRVFRRIVVTGVAAAALLAPAAGAASASAAVAAPTGTGQGLRLTGGHTSLYTAPGVAVALLGRGIVPIATLPGTEGVTIGKNGVVARFSFPVTGGRLTLSPLGATVRHSGGILFLSPSTGKQILVSNFTIRTKSALLTAEVNGNPKVRVPLLRLSLAHAKIAAGRHAAMVSGIVARLTKVAANALNATFGTSLFTPGLELGTATTLLRY